MTKTNVSRIGATALFATIVSIGLSASAFAYTPLTAQMDPGARGYNVTNLQTFFADNASIYPEGLVTGYFGGLTKIAVMRFQAQYGFDQVGRVGPATLGKINSLIATGGWTVVDATGPSFYSVNQSQTSNSATFSFNTSENTMARVVYNTSPLMFNEGDVNSNGFGAIGGFAANSVSGMSTSHSVTIPGLSANTTYYYTVIATDSTGNVSVVGPNNSFRTNQ